MYEYEGETKRERSEFEFDACDTKMVGMWQQKTEGKMQNAQQTPVWIVPQVNGFNGNTGR